jgi:hypothetical protein
MNIHNMYKLKTKEDPYHIHKSLGIICLMNYIYRYSLLFLNGTMNLNNDTAVTLIYFHAGLSLTSMIFHIPSIRNKTAPMIFPEYRLHSIFFALRSILCFMITYYNYSIFYKFICCYSVMGLADLVTHQYKNNKSESEKTMRSMPFDKRIPEPDQREIIICQSSNQISATLFMFGNLDSCFSPMFSIQIAAFLMTLVRKSIITANSWHISYNISLWINAFCYLNLPINFVILQIILYHFFRIWRFKFSGNKYIAWSINFFILYLLQNWSQQDVIGPPYSNLLKYSIILYYLAYNVNTSIKLLC